MNHLARQECFDKRHPQHLAQSIAARRAELQLLETCPELQREIERLIDTTL